MNISRHSIPYEDFGGQGPLLHFSHANGYPPGAYRPLFARLSADFHVLAMHMRPLWPGSDPAAISDWQPLSADLACFLDQRQLPHPIGAGHSMGATTTLRLALREPDRFEALVLIDPVLFPPYMTRFWRLVSGLGLGYRLHPLVKGALKRRTNFDSRDAMHENYRRKSVFRRLNDEHLTAYVDALACTSSDGRLARSVQLCYPAAWEARIYVTGILADLEIWRTLGSLRPPLLIIRGAETDTFWAKTAALVKRKLASTRIETIPDATHLVPLEHPDQVYRLISDFLTKRISSTSHKT
jgi:pimeloyl-ACP methyl ester carboxylesterase